MMPKAYLFSVSHSETLANIYHLPLITIDDYTEWQEWLIVVNDDS